MKYILIALLVISTPIDTSAQKHSLWADVGFNPGFSITYNYKPAKRVGLGIGIQGYRFTPVLGKVNEFIPGLFADARLSIRPEKSNQFFSFLDAGIDFYKNGGLITYENSVEMYNVYRNNGFYTGLGFGYFRRVTKHGGGPYASLKMVLNWCQVKKYNYDVGGLVSRLVTGDGTLAFSLGFKF